MEGQPDVVGEAIGVVVAPCSAVPDITATCDARKCRAWNFTLFNYTDVDEDKLKALDCVHLVYGHEICPDTSRAHLQGYVRFRNPVGFAFVKMVIRNDVHLTPVRKDNGAAAYCKKDGDFFEKGTPAAQGKRSDIEAIKEYIHENPTVTMKMLRESHPIAACKYAKFCELVLRDVKPKIQPPSIVLRDWQSRLISVLHAIPDPRHIYVLVDPIGGAGKTTFAEYILSTFEQVEYYNQASSRDIYYVVQEPKIVIFDFSKCTGEYVPWAAVESVKNGLIFSSKYEGGLKRFARPHVLVMCNVEPPESAFSSDRPQIIRLSTLTLSTQ